jgi:hypothetical protein
MRLSSRELSKKVFMKKRKYTVIVMVGVPVILSIIGFFYLPERCSSMEQRR